MKREIITISDSGAINVPKDARMTISEIADLFEIFYQTTKRTIRAIEKSGVADGDYSMTCTVNGLNVCPEYYGLEMIIAVAFHVHSGKTKIFRRWALRKVVRRDITTTLVLPLQNTMLN